MKTVIARVKRNDSQGMDGDWFLPSGIKLVFGTLPWKNNRPDISSIPFGLKTFHYVKSAGRSLKMGKDIFVYEMFDSTPTDEVDDTDGREHIQIHTGNYYGDVSEGYKSDVKGCFVLGVGFSKDGVTGQRIVVRSNDAIELFVAQMKKEPFILDFGVET